MVLQVPLERPGGGGRRRDGGVLGFVAAEAVRHVHHDLGLVAHRVLANLRADSRIVSHEFGPPGSILTFLHAGFRDAVAGGVVCNHEPRRVAQVKTVVIIAAGLP